ncbi:MAG: AI-2E family transporter [bacterium]|nr:AI-2E family transporter [bacterium]
MEQRYFEITWASLWRILAFVLALIILYFIREIVILLALAIVISAICRPFVDYLSEKKVARFLGTSFVFLSVLVILGLFLWLVVPLVIYQFGNFITNFNETISKIGSSNILGELIQQFIINLKAAFDVLANGVSTIFNLIFSIFGGIFMAITCLVLAFYLTVEEKGIENFFRSILPESYEDRIISILNKSTARIGRWFQGRIILSIIIGLLTWLGLYLLGVKYSGTLALLTAVLDIIPLVGPIFAGLIVFLAALTNSWLLAIWAVLFFFIIQHLEGMLLAPLIMKKMADLPPLVVLLAVLIGTQIAGLIGFLLAIPAAIFFQEIFEQSVRKKKQT